MSTLTPEACAAEYRALRTRVAELVRSVTPTALEREAPATPGWRVRDLLAHMVGVNTDILTGTLDGVATDAWTGAQVDARRTVEVETLLGEWEESASAVEANAAMLGAAAGQWLYDACTHEHDLRQAVRAPGARDSGAVALAYEWGTDRLGELLDHRSAPALDFRTDYGGDKTVGQGAPATVVRTSRFEVLRALTGRRSRAQIERWDWAGEPRPADLPLAIFALRPDDLDE